MSPSFRLAIAISALTWLTTASASGQNDSSAGATPNGLIARGTVDVARSRIFVKIGATGLGHEHGAEGRVKSGTLSLDAQPQAGEIAFDMSSFVTETPASRRFVGLPEDVDDSTAKQVTTNMLGPNVLDIKKYPTATYRIRLVTPLPRQKPTDPVGYRLEGDFTLHGVSRPLTLDARADVVEGMIRLRTQFAILQTQYGIKPFAKLLGAVGVADEVKIWGELWIAQ